MSWPYDPDHLERTRDLLYGLINPRIRHAK